MGKKKKPIQNNTIAVIGLSTFIGKNLLRYLELEPHTKNVIAIDVRPPTLTLRKTRFYKLDLTETLADVTLSEILKKEKVGTLIHAAFPSTPPRNEAMAHELVAIGSFYIYNACAAAGVRKIVMASTTDVYGAFPTNPNFLTEDMPPKGGLQDKLIADKVDAEKQALKYQQKHPGSVVTLVRPCTILGPTIDTYKTRYLRRPVVTTMLGFDPLVQFVHEADVINTFVKMIEEDHPGIFNLAGDGVLPLSRVIEICGKFNLKLTQIGFKTLVQLLWFADIAPAPASHVNFLRYLCVADNHKIKKMGFTPRYSTKETLLSFVGSERIKQFNLAEG